MAYNASELCERVRVSLGGTVYQRELDEWIIRWVSDGDYRHICSQSHPSGEHDFIVVLLNPGSLSGDGAGLKKDLTLRILRKVFEGTKLNPVVVNLFDRATAQPLNLISNWSVRDKSQAPLVYDVLDCNEVAGYMFAYGDHRSVRLRLEQSLIVDIESRVSLYTKRFTNWRKLEGFQNRNKTPMHPRVWQTNGHIEP